MLGYSNDISGYVSTARAIEEGGYEPNSFYAVGWLLPGPLTMAAESMILEAAAKLARPKAGAHK